MNFTAQKLAYIPDDLNLCITECSGIKFKTMWVIQRKNDNETTRFLRPMEHGVLKKPVLYFHYERFAFRFPDEQTAQAVLKFLNRDNLEVTCIE